MEMNNNNSCSKVCVTGGGGYIGSYLVKKLLQEGHIVHATLRNLDDQYKVGLLKSLPYADSRLLLFKADIYDPEEFDLAIKGCDFVFHLATPLQHNTQSSQYKDTSEAAIGGVRSIVRCCIRSGTVKRLIYTASVVAASPLKDDGTGFKNSINESCWTPLHLTFAHSNHLLKGYTHSKTEAEKELLSYNNKGIDGFEVVTLVCGLVGGDTVLSYLAESVKTLISQLMTHENVFQVLMFLEGLLGKLPIVHIDDVCEAHIFCMKKPSIHGRYLCARDYVSSKEISDYFRQHYPELPIEHESLEVERGITWNSTKLDDMGFQYKHDMKKILDDSVESARKIGDL